MNILEVAAQVAVLVLAGLESTTADRAEQQLGRGGDRGHRR